MHRKHTLFAKCASGLLSFSLIMSMIPSVPAWAEDDFSEDISAEEAALDADVEVPSSIFYITKFPGFEKDDQGHFTDEQTKEKYGDLKAAPGTSLEDLKLPEDLDLEGYWEADGPDAPSTLTLEKIDWKLKTDNPEEIYSESSPEGTYTFTPDYEAYVADDESLDDILLAEGVKDLTIDVVIAPEETEPETTAETETAAPADDAQTQPADPSADTEAVVTDPSAEPAVSDDTAATDGDITIPDAAGDTTTDASANDNGNINIFDTVDDSVINASTQEEYKGSEEDSTTDNGTVLLPDDSQAQPVVVQEDTSAQTESTAQEETTAQSETTVQEETTAPAETTAESDAAQPETTADAQTQDAPQGEPAVQATTLIGTLQFFNPNATNPVYTYPADGTKLTLTANDTNANVEPAITLPCNAVLTNPTVKFVADGVEQPYTLTTADFATNSTQRITFTDATNNQYSVQLTLTQNAHQFDAATCNHLSTCTVCGATTGDYAAHTNAGNATCTKNATCSVCSAELSGTALGHDWKDATCTTPKTCSRCQATEGKALGHDLRDDWETMEASTYSSHGYQERFCHRDNCDYTEDRDLNIVGNPNDNAIQNLSEGATYDINTRLTFSAYGAASENSKPIANDVRYIPSTWSIQGTAGTWLDNFSGAFSISKTGTYTVTVTFQKQVYGDGSWQNTDIADSKTVTFSIGGNSSDGTNDAVRINPQTGDQTPILPFVIVLIVAAIVIIVVVIMRKKKQN